MRRSCARGTGSSLGATAARKRGQVARDLVQALLDPAERIGAARRERRPAAPRAGRSSPPCPSSRREIERRRRVTRSMSAAEGRLSAPMAASWACSARSRASKARAIAPFTTGLAISSSATLPSASSPCLDSFSTKVSSRSGSSIARQATRSPQWQAAGIAHLTLKSRVMRFGTRRGGTIAAREARARSGCRDAGEQIEGMARVGRYKDVISHFRPSRGVRDTLSPTPTVPRCSTKALK